MPPVTPELGVWLGRYSGLQTGAGLGERQSPGPRDSVTPDVLAPLPA